MVNAKDEIISECALLFANNSDDCNKFVKAVCAIFFEPDLFTGPSMNADAIVDELRNGGDWVSLGTSHDQAISDALGGKMVIAGMTSGELGSSHGHLAIVVGDDGQASGTITVPICYAGSLNPTARVQRKRVSETFGAQFARQSKISYFSREPQTIPAVPAVSRLVNRLRGLHEETLVKPATSLKKAKPSKPKKKIKASKQLNK